MRRLQRGATVSLAWPSWPAIGVTPSGEDEVLGFDIGLSEEAPFWATFLGDLAARDLRGVPWVISDANPGAPIRDSPSPPRGELAAVPCALYAQSDQATA